MSTSTRPKPSIAASTSCWHCSGTLTSVATDSALRPVASTSAAVACSLSARRAPMTTSAPASAKARAKDTPNPDDPPVTITTLSSSRNESSTLISYSTFRLSTGPNVSDRYYTPLDLVNDSSRHLNSTVRTVFTGNSFAEPVVWLFPSGAQPARLR
jgi:hypothetical protein